MPLHFIFGGEKNKIYVAIYFCQTSSSKSVDGSLHLIGYPEHQVKANRFQIKNDAELVDIFPMHKGGTFGVGRSGFHILCKLRTYLSAQFIESLRQLLFFQMFKRF